MVWPILFPYHPNPVLWDCYAYLAKIHTLTIESGWEMVRQQYNRILTLLYGIATYLAKFHIISIVAGYRIYPCIIMHPYFGLHFPKKKGGKQNRGSDYEKIA